MVSSKWVLLQHHQVQVRLRTRWHRISHVDMIASMIHAEPLATPLVLRLHYKLLLTLHSTSSSIICILTPTTLAVWRLCTLMKLKMTMPVLPTSRLRASLALQLIWLPLHHWSSAEKWDSLGIFHQRMKEMVTLKFLQAIITIVTCEIWLPLSSM